MADKRSAVKETAKAVGLDVEEGSTRNGAKTAFEISNYLDAFEKTDRINIGSLLYLVNKNKALEWMTQQPTYSADVDNPIKNLDYVANINKYLS